MSGVLSMLDIELIDHVYTDIHDCYLYIKSLLGVMTQEEEIIALLQSKSVQDYDRVIKGLVFGVMAGEDWMRSLAFTNRDQYQIAAVTLERLLPKLRSLDRARTLLLEMWKQNSPQLQSLIITFLRISELSTLLRTNIEWVSQQPAHFPSFVFFRTLKSLSLHYHFSDPALQEDVHVLQYLWTRRRGDCLGIGKEVLLMLFNISSLPDVEPIFADLQAANNSLLLDLLHTPTSWVYQSLLLSPFTEEKLKFVLEKVSPAQYPRYLLWLVSPLPLSAIPDIVRFILTFDNVSIPPSNRWKAVIWLLDFVTDRETRTKIKFSFIFDLIFASESDGLRLIEPLMEFLQTGIAQKPELINEILQFLLITVEKFQTNLQPIMVNSVKNGIKIAEEQGVISPFECILREVAIHADVRMQFQALLSRQQVPRSPELEMTETDEEEVTLSLPEYLFQSYGDTARQLAVQPTFERLKQLLHVSNKVDDGIAEFVLKCLMQEMAGNLTQFVSEDSMLVHIFQAAEHDLNCRELVKIMREKEAGIGVRLLVYSARVGSNLYQSLEFKSYLERDLQSGLLDMTLETLSWLFPYVFEHMSTTITPSIIRFFLQICPQELLARVQFDLLLRKYSLLQDKVKEIIELAGELTTVEQLYMWKLIVSEVPGDKMDVVIEAVQKCVTVISHWEMLSGLITFIGKWHSHLTTEHARLLLGFPSKHFAQAIHIALSFAKPSNIEEAILFMMQKSQFHAQINVLRHVKFWFENGLKLRIVVRSRAIQEVLGSTLQSLSSEYYKEFSGVLESSRPGYVA